MNLRQTALLIATAATMLAADGRRVINRIPVPGDYGWDYLRSDSDGRRLYVSHQREIIVIDLDSEKIIGKISEDEKAEVHGTAIDHKSGRGFISNTDPGSVTIFDLKTLAKVDKVRVGESCLTGRRDGCSQSTAAARE
jgi:DNA-binding beta-propeller fold protein YncE